MECLLGTISKTTAGLSSTSATLPVMMPMISIDDLVLPQWLRRHDNLASALRILPNAIKDPPSRSVTVAQHSTSPFLSPCHHRAVQPWRTPILALRTLPIAIDHNSRLNTPIALLYHSVTIETFYSGAH